MKKQLLLCTIALIAINSISAKAQQVDTTKYDLGRITLDKKFTQAVTVKGIDLQKLPFTTLSDAVNTWFYGVYGSAVNYVTVIDGNLISDINAYSVYDIEEVTLVQNSLTHLNGISPNQILLLVKTRRGNRPGKSGIEINGQSNMVGLRNTSGSGKSTTGFYHQYYVSPYINTEQIHAGVSAGFQQNAFPTTETATFQAKKPNSFYRVKLNAYLDAKLGKSNTFSVSAGYVSQVDSSEYSGVIVPTLTQKTTDHVSQNLVHADVKLLSTIIPKLTNTFSAGLQRVKLHDQLNSFYTGTNVTGQPVNRSFVDTSANALIYLIKDNLAYQAHAGLWLIEPNLNFTFRQFKKNSNLLNRNTDSVGGVTTFISSSSFYYDYLQKSATLTPSLSVSYGDAFLLQGGAEYFLNSTINNPLKAQSKFSSPKILPFASLTVNLLQSAAGDNPKTKLLVYGSYAKSLANMTDFSASLRDVGNPAPANTTGSGFVYFDQNYNPYKTYDQLQAGATLSLLNKKLTFSYNYSVRKYNQAYAYPIAVPTGGAASYIAIYFIYPDQRVDLHRIGIEFKAIQNTSFSWTTAFNGSVAKLNTYFSSDNTNGFLSSSNSIMAGNITTGGFINRFTYKKLTGGLDVLYRINEDRYPLFTGTSTKGNINSVDLKNIYVGYQLNPKNIKGLELFVNARNILQNDQSDITDNRRFYGLGFKLGL